MTNTDFVCALLSLIRWARTRSARQCNGESGPAAGCSTREAGMLTGAIEAAKVVGEAVLLTGEAGVGKTRLLIEAHREAERQGLLVLKGRAVESGGARPS